MDERILAYRRKVSNSFLKRHSVCSYTSGSLTASRPPSRDGSDRRDKERAPVSRETKRLLKQKSQESFKDNNKSVTSIPYIDASPPSSNGLGTASNGLGLSCSKASFVSSPNHKGKCTSCRLHKTIEWNGLGVPLHYQQHSPSENEFLKIL